MLILILITTLLRVEAFCPPNVTGRIAENLKSKSESKYRELVYIEKLRFTLRMQESGFDYSAIGANGEIGAYQFMPVEWAKKAMKYLHREVPATIHYQDTIAFCDIQELVMKKGYTIDQIAAFWNSGNPNSRKKGINKAGVPFDVPAYINSFKKVYESIDRAWGNQNQYNLFLYTRTDILVKKS